MLLVMLKALKLFYDKTQITNITKEGFQKVQNIQICHVEFRCSSGKHIDIQQLLFFPDA